MSQQNVEFHFRLKQVDPQYSSKKALILRLIVKAFSPSRNTTLIYTNLFYILRTMLLGLSKKVSLCIAKHIL